MLHATAAQDHAIRQLQGITKAVAAGAAATTDITVTGIGVKDQITSVIMFASGTPSDVTSEATITAVDTIQLSTTNSTGNELLVEYLPYVGS